MENQIDIFDFFDSKNKMRSHFESNDYLTREELAQMLGIDRTTIWRWEREIINLVLLVGRDYKDQPTHLNPYQSFILMGIYALRNGFIERRPYRYEEIKDYLKQRQKTLTRKQFEAWIGAIDNGQN